MWWSRIAFQGLIKFSSSFITGTVSSSSVRIDCKCAILIVMTPPINPHIAKYIIRCILVGYHLAAKNISNMFWYTSLLNHIYCTQEKTSNHTISYVRACFFQPQIGHKKYMIWTNYFILKLSTFKAIFIHSHHDNWDIWHICGQHFQCPHKQSCRWSEMSCDIVFGLLVSLEALPSKPLLQFKEKITVIRC